MIITITIVAIILLGGIVYTSAQEDKLKKQKLNINLLKLKNYNFPLNVLNEFKKQYPKLTEQEVKQVESGLKDFFALVLLNPRQSIAMPSRVIDDLWHIFLEDKEEYSKFSKLIEKEVKHVADEKAEKGFDRTKPVRHVSKDVRKTYQTFQSSQNNSMYDFSYMGVFPLLFIMDNHLASVDYGYFYDNESFQLMNERVVASTESSSSCSSSTTSTSSCSSSSCSSSGSCGDSSSSCGSGGCSCSSGSSCGSSCGGGCGGGCGGS